MYIYSEYRYICTQTLAPILKLLLWLLKTSTFWRFGSASQNMEVVWFSGRGSWRTDIRGASLAKCLVLLAAGARSYCGSSEAEYLNTCSSLFLNGSTVLPEKIHILKTLMWTKWFSKDLSRFSCALLRWAKDIQLGPSSKQYMVSA